MRVLLITKKQEKRTPCRGTFPLRVERLQSSRLKSASHRTVLSGLQTISQFEVLSNRSGSVRLTFANISLKYNPFPKWRQQGTARVNAKKTGRSRFDKVFDVL
ncbi:hypothetical protein [Cardiobacterium hominis]|uniref:hypothetical protein n=1 Tax=Cardiobacterium hominis TaxID=2718 RepID=UPI0028E388A5|nr:hypothetical protein [Cardiobacterium hominis]